MKFDDKNNCEEFFDPRLVTLDPRPSTKRQIPVKVADIYRAASASVSRLRFGE